MERVTFTCSRCGVTAIGHEDEHATAGFYRVDGDTWGRYARPGESVLCEPCMWADPAYVQVYAPAATGPVYTPGKPVLEVVEEAAAREFGTAGRSRGL